MGLTAVLSTLCGQLVTQYAAEAGMSNIQFMTSVAMVTGFLELILVITRVTIIIDLISAPIIFGFSTGAGIAIMCGQLPTLMGIKGINGKQPAFRILGDTIRSFDRTGIDFTVGAISLLILWGWTKMARVLGAKGFTWAPYLGHASNAIVLIIMPIVGYLANQGKVVPVFKTVGNVPTGLGRMHIPDVFKNFSPVLSASLTVVLVNCIEHIAVTKLFARKKGYKISPRNEIMNIGIMNIWGSLNGGIPVGGIVINNFSFFVSFTC
jgi:sodium-independent sulfate anion transporter 11